MNEFEHDPEFPFIVTAGTRILGKFTTEAAAEDFARPVMSRVVRDTAPAPEYEDNTILLRKGFYPTISLSGVLYQVERTGDLRKVDKAEYGKYLNAKVIANS